MPKKKLIKSPSRRTEKVPKSKHGYPWRTHTKY